ncbi:predicted protein [Chaetoceros tenuissimus]|uniref:Follistatin-like domain-containing protein n=1 Tax=Chaetoceros tenuissimus TaxID=426638 RepID=A0AAD3GZ93_9STRA|nr:predicted protein [Chaetoceros tenuissimus]
MYSKNNSTYTSLFLLLLLFSPLLVSGRGVRRRNRQKRTTDFTTGGKDPCRKVTCESPCAADPCRWSEICTEVLPEGECCPVAECIALDFTFTQCSDPCANHSCGSWQTCRTVQFEGEPCLTAFCSDVESDTPTPDCGGVVCEDPCPVDHVCPVDPDDTCGYDECEYDLLPIDECCPTASGQGVRRRESSFSNKGKKASCIAKECASPCEANLNPCRLDEFCSEVVIAGNCCPDAKCSRCNPGLKSKCPDPCENFTCRNGKVCRAIEFENRCCPKAMCSYEPAGIPLPDTDPNSPINLCEGVVCTEDPCNCPTDLDRHDGCGYKCAYDPFSAITNCCPTSSTGCIAHCEDTCPSDYSCPDPCENFSCGDGEVCRAIKFEGRCCPKAICSKSDGITASCDNVKCANDPCDCHDEILLASGGCDIHCHYDPFATSECCPSSSGCQDVCM